MESAIVITDTRSARRATAEVPGCYKILSWLYLHCLAVPTVQGIVVHSWDDAAVFCVEDFCNELGVDSVMVRSDQAEEVRKPTYGGRIVPLVELDATVPPLLEMGRTVFLLEPLSLYNMTTSVGAAYWPADGAIALEVLGPGFDASDLKWGDVVPHEVFMVPVSVPGRRWLRDCRIRLVDQAAYQASVSQRLEKIGRIERNGYGGADGEERRRLGRRFLEQTGERLLLSGDPYVEVSADRLMEVLGVVLRLIARLTTIGAPGPPLATYMNYHAAGERPVYWDVIWPELKYKRLRHIG